VTLAAELGDLTRFDNPRQLAAFVGLIPSEYSTGASRRLGPITKAGNGHARRAAEEAAGALSGQGRGAAAVWRNPRRR
jgi:transposase